MFLTAQEAANELGVSLETLYAYVSRKLVRSQKVPNSRKRQYWLEDIEKLKGKVERPENEFLVPRSSITLIRPDGPFYRGRNAIELAETETLESICALLWEDELGEKSEADALHFSDVYHRVGASLEGVSIIEKACALLPLLERANPRSFDLSHPGYCRTGMQVMRWFSAIASGALEPSDEPIHLVIGHSLNASEPLIDIIRRVLVISADHELDPTTYAVRAVANTGVSAYQAVLAGLAASQGRRLTFGRWDSLSRMMNEIIEGSNPGEAILGRFREGEPIYGFGSRIYPAGDPRAVALLRWLDDAFGESDVEFRRLKDAISIAREVIGEEPDFVIPLSFLGRKLGQTGNEVILLRTARLGGWIAHAIEQYLSQDLIRPRTTYRGLLPSL